MTPEDKNNPLPEWLRQQQERDQAWVRLNYDVLWAVAAMSHDLVGRGAVGVDARSWQLNGPLPTQVVFDYISQERVDKLGLEKLSEMVREYQEETEFVVALFKPNNLWSSYRIQIRERPGLLDIESKEKLPPLYSQEALGLDALARIKFFMPDGNWVWYASEFDGDDLFFGLVSGFAVELGYFSLHALERRVGPLGLPIERDQHFEPKTLRELGELHKRGGTT
jgi:hypothetical protein